MGRHARSYEGEGLVHTTTALCHTNHFCFKIKISSEIIIKKSSSKCNTTKDYGDLLLHKL